jgi:hypothetical protein
VTLLDESFGLEEVSLTTLLELAELKPNADNLVNLVYDGDEKSSLRLPILMSSLNFSSIEYLYVPSVVLKSNSQM